MKQSVYEMIKNVFSNFILTSRENGSDRSLRTEISTK